MKTTEIKKAVAGVLALRNLKLKASIRRSPEEMLLDLSEISTLVTANQRERPFTFGSTMLH